MGVSIAAASCERISPASGLTQLESERVQPHVLREEVIAFWQRNAEVSRLRSARNNPHLR